MKIEDLLKREGRVLMLMQLEKGSPKPPPSLMGNVIESVLTVDEDDGSETLVYTFKNEDDARTAEGIMLVRLVEQLAAISGVCFCGNCDTKHKRFTP